LVLPQFSQLIVEVLAARTSDHTHLYVSLHDLNGRQRTRKLLFRYEAWWQKKQGFTQVVKQVWKQKIGGSNPWGPVKEKTTKNHKWSFTTYENG
jgi:hypothetical protein